MGLTTRYKQIDLVIRKCVILSICLLAYGVAPVARADDLLQSYDIKDAVEYGVVEKIHEDDRGIYYWGPLQWNAPQYDPDDYEIVNIVAFMKPQGPKGRLLSGTEFNGELHRVQQPLFKLADSEIDYFNSVLLPRLLAVSPWLDEIGSVDMRGYALGLHFDDSKYFAESRANHRILPEEALFGISWRRNDKGRYVPHYEATGDAGIAVADWPYEGATRKFWATVASARMNRAERGAATDQSAVLARQSKEQGAEASARGPSFLNDEFSVEELRAVEEALLGSRTFSLPAETPSFPPEQHKRLSAAQEAPYAYTRIGLGYAFHDATNLLIGPLPRAAPTPSDAMPAGQLPDSCFKHPGITAVKEYSTADQQQTRRILEGVAGLDGPLLIACGQQSAPIKVSVEVSRDGNNWLIDDAPDDRVLNHHLKRFITDFAKHYKAPPPARKGEMVEYTNASGMRVFAATIIESQLLFIVDIDHKEDRDGLLTLLSDAGKRSTPTKGDEIADYRVVINYGRLDANTLFEQLRGFWKYAHNTASLVLDISNARLEKEIGELDEKIEAIDNIERILNESQKN